MKSMQKTAQKTRINKVRRRAFFTTLFFVLSLVSFGVEASQDISESGCCEAEQVSQIETASSLEMNCCQSGQCAKTCCYSSALGVVPSFGEMTSHLSQTRVYLKNRDFISQSHLPDDEPPKFIL